MKKSLLLATILGATGAFAADSYLYWMIDTSSANDFTYSYVRIKDASTDKYLTIYDSAFDYAYTDGSGDGVAKTYIKMADDMNSGFYASLADIDPASASFIVELYSSSDKFLARNFSASTGEIAGYIYSGGIAPMPVSPWMAGSFDIPEPSSGLLVLVGCALLGLRRRRQARENA